MEQKTGQEMLALLTGCRDHWKTAFEHERTQVIRLRAVLHEIHGDECECRDCQLVKNHHTEPKASCKAKLKERNHGQ